MLLNFFKLRISNFRLFLRLKIDPRVSSYLFKFFFFLITHIERSTFINRSQTTQIKSSRVFSVSPWHQSSPEVLPHSRGAQTLPRGERGLHRPGRNPGHPAGPGREQRPQRLRQEERPGSQRLLDRRGRHCERGPVRGCEQRAGQLLKLGPLQEAAYRDQEGKLRGPVGGRAGQVARRGVSESEEVHLRVRHTLKERERESLGPDNLPRVTVWLIMK